MRTSEIERRVVRLEQRMGTLHGPWSAVELHQWREALIAQGDPEGVIARSI